MELKSRTARKNPLQNANICASHHFIDHREPMIYIHSKIKINSRSKQIIPKTKPQLNRKNKEVRLQILRNSKQTRSSREKTCKDTKKKRRSKQSNGKTINNTKQSSTIKRQRTKQSHKPLTNHLLKMKLSQQSISSKQNLFSTIDEGQKHQMRYKKQKIRKSKDSEEMNKPIKSQQFLKIKGITEQAKILLQQLKQFPTMKDLCKNRVRDFRQQLCHMIQAERIRNMKRDQQLKNLHGKEAKRLQKIHMIERSQAKRNIQALKKLNEKSLSQEPFQFSHEK